MLGFEYSRYVDKTVRSLALSLLLGSLMFSPDKNEEPFYLSVAANEEDAKCWSIDSLDDEVSQEGGRAYDPLLYFFDLENPEDLIWAHAINDHSRLENAARSCAHMVEADIQLIDGEIVVAHPPKGSSDISFAQLVSMVMETGKGLKLDFKDIEAIPVAIAYLDEVDFGLPLVINFGVATGPNGAFIPVEQAQRMLLWLHTWWPDAVISPCWLTGSEQTGSYTPEMIAQMEEVLSVFGDSLPTLTFPVDLFYLRNSQTELVQLLTDYPDATLTVYYNHWGSQSNARYGKQLLTQPPFVGRVYREWSE